ncbi:endoplasmic reticulum-Golgi intermediate compartment protein 2-like isoform X2 [Haliotis cracherodii]|uniref:endoplasmic reticulum-Golgi intermediate compartment protein 2-like n=1 Tax=Haliotis rufescens TaxID=6454 RepID=UPI00201EF01C|nr:endoplasmic reticulum-Golgi intermediate compartment protein 2-like [Haliotis rufescens]
MRRLNVASKNKALKVVKELDAFPKVPESYKETTATGGGLSIITFIIIAILVISEIKYYTDTELKFDYEVDTNVTGKIKINVDLTVAMKCSSIGADVLDLTGQDVHSYGRLKEEDTYFELTPNQQKYHTFLQEINRYLQEEYHAIQDLMWKSKTPAFRGGMPPRETNPEHGPDACRVHGSLEVNKVAGNFHITAGKSVPMIPRGHAHIAIMLSERDYNFSHRIDHLSFGEPVSGVIYPLDGELQSTKAHFHTFQYYIQVVPTEVRTYLVNENTYQFAVSQRSRQIDHSKGSHGVPGIFVKYDLSSLMIRVREEHKPYWQFMIRLCGIIGGVFSVSGMMHGLSGFLVDLFCCRFKMGKYKPKSFEEASQSATPPSPSLSNPPQDDPAGVSLLAQPQ